MRETRSDAEAREKSILGTVNERRVCEMTVCTELTRPISGMTGIEAG